MEQTLAQITKDFLKVSSLLLVTMGLALDTIVRVATAFQVPLDLQLKIHS